MVKRLMTVLGVCAALGARAAVVPVPAVPVKWYTGALQTADVPESAAYVVLANDGGTGAGEYEVFLELVNPGDVWVDASGAELPDTVACAFWEIARAPNAWTRAPAIAGWMWGEPAEMPDAAAAFGTVKVRYSGTTANGAAVTDALSVTAAGEYTATFTVDGTADYSGLSASVAFTVARGTLSGGGASGGARIDARGYAGIYDGAAHAASVEIANAQPGETFRVTYSTDGTVYTAEAPSFSDAGTYTVWYRVESDSYATVENTATVTIAKKEIAPPTVASKVYDGAAQTADVPESADWRVVANGGGTGAGEYDVFLELADARNTAWTTTDDEVAVVTFTITKAGNVWTEAPALAGWTYGDAANVPTGAARFGVPAVTYSGTTAAGTAVENAASVSAAGDYTARFTVAETADYGGLSAEVAFTVARATVGGGGTSGGAKLEASGWEGEYDGAAHSISVTVTGAAADENFRVSYATDAAGPFGAANPGFVDVGTYTVWYRVEADSYAPVEGSETVVIRPAPVRCAELEAGIGWTYLKATGTWFAQITVTCTEGLAAGIGNLRFLFEDRTGDDGKLRAALWSSAPGARRAVASTQVIDGVTYRSVELDAAKIVAENSAVVFGVQDLGAGTVPAAERVVELYVAKRVAPEAANAGAAEVDGFVGYLVWESGGETRSLPLAAGAAARAAVTAVLRRSEPVAARALNASLAVGVPLETGLAPACALEIVSVGAEELTLRLAVGAVTAAGARVDGALGANATVTVFGAATPAGPWRECATARADAAGRVTVPKTEGCTFFRARVNVEDVVR